MILTVAHQKGGTGKSTLATNLAVELGAELLDLDKQHSSIIFNCKRIRDGLPAISCYSIAESQCQFDYQQPVTEAHLPELFAWFKQKPGHLVVDVGGFDSPLNRKALFFADYILTPCAPSAVEIYGLQMFEEILEKAEEIADLHLVSHVVINNADTRSTKRIGDMQEYIHGKPNHFKLCQTIIGSRIAFKTAYEQGRSVSELLEESKSAKLKRKYQRSAEEINSLVHEITSDWEG